MESQSLIGVNEASRILGCHRATLWLHRKTGQFQIEPVVTIGNHALFDEAQIRAVAGKKTENMA